MSKLYTTNTAALKAVTIDSNTIDAKKLKIYPGTGEKTERKDIIEIIDDNIDELESQLNPYLNQQIHSTPDGGGTMGVANILVIPANIFNPSKFFKYVKFDTVTPNGVEDIPAYLGIILWDKNGNKTVLAVSENSEITSTKGTKLFSFSKAFSIPADTRILFYLLKSQEDIASEYPNYDANTTPKINCTKTIASNYDPYPNDWDNALADINEGFIVNGSWAVNHAYASWPVFSMIEDFHELNGSHLTPEQYQKLENLNLSDIPSIDNLVTKDNPDWQETKQQVIIGTLKEKYYTTNLENRTNATHGVGIKIDKAHFIPGSSIINDITLPYGEGGNNGFSEPHWCHIYPYDANDTLIGDAIISTTSATRPADNEGETSWDFAGNETSKLPENYEYIVIKVSGTSNPHPNDDGSNIRILVANISSTSDHGSFGDKCQVIGSGNYLGIVNVNYSEADKTLLEHIEVLETTTGEHTTSINTHTEEIAEIKGKIDGVTKTGQFSNLTSVNNVCSAHSIQLSKAHFIEPNNVITKLYLPYKENDVRIQNQYSHIQFFDESGTLISQFDSEDYQTREASATGESVWTYNNVVVPEYRFVRFTLSGSKSDNPNGQTGSACTKYRINVVTQENNNILFDDDDCKIWTGGSEHNWVGEVKVDYTYVEGLNNTIVELKDSITELESKNYAYTDTENTFAENINVNKILYANNSISPESNVASISTNDKLIVGRESITSADLDEIKSIVLGKESHKVINTESASGVYEVVCARIENPHFPSGTISNIRIFHNILHTALFDNTPRYLYLNVDGTVYRSHAVVYDGPVSYSDFRFDNITIPSTYTFVDVLMSTNPGLENPSWTNFSGAVNFSASMVYKTDTYGNSQVRIPSGVGDQSAIIKVEATTGEETTETLSARLTRIEEQISRLLTLLE